MTMPRPSLVTSSGPSPVRGFIAAILPSPSSGRYRPACADTARYGTAYAIIPVRAVEPASHNRFYLSPYYPVFGSRMVMIGHPGRREYASNGLFPGSSADPAARRSGNARGGPRAGRAGVVEQDLVQVVQVPVALEADPDAGVQSGRPVRLGHQSLWEGTG